MSNVKCVTSASVVVVLLCLSGCGEATETAQIECGEGTVEREGSCLPVDNTLERPEGAEELITDDQLERIKAIGVSIYGGSNPPDIAGRYHSNNALLVYNETEGGWLDNPADRPICEAYWEYTATDEANKYDVSRMLTECDGGYEGKATYISGTGNCFTTYSSVSGSFEGCKRDDINVRSGCLTDEGIVDTSRANIGSNYEGDSCQQLIEDGRIAAEGEVRLRQEGIMMRVDSQ